MKKRLPSFYGRSLAARQSLLRAAREVRAAKGKAPSPMRFPAWGGQGGYGSWRTLLPSAEYDYEAAAQPLWQNTAVAACLGWIRKNFAEPSLEVVKESAAATPTPGRGKKPGTVRVVPDSKAVALLDRPNDHYDRYTFWGACCLSAIVDGNAYIRKVRDGLGRVVQLWYLPFWLVSPRWDPDGSEYIGWYEYRIDGVLERIEVADMVHFRNGQEDRDGGRVAWSPLKAACREICGLNDAAGFTASIMRNMGVPGVIISSAVPDGNFPADELPTLRDQFREQFTGEGRGSAMFAPMPIKVDKITFSPEELALDRIPSRLEAVICSLVGVPAMVVGLATAHDARTYSNYGEARRAAYEDCLIPLQKAFAECLTNQLLLPDFDEGDRFRWDYSGVQCLLDNEDQLADRVGKLYQMYQVVTRAEARETLGYDWTDDDEVYYPEAMLRLTDREDLPGEGTNPGGPGEVSAADADAADEQVAVDDQIAKDMEATGSKKSETIDKQLKEQGLGEDSGGGSRSAPDEADDRAIGPKATHKASSAAAILAVALKGRGWTGRYNAGELTFDERHDVLGDISTYATDWLRHEATAFFAEHGDDGDSDRGLVDGDDRRGDLDGRGVVLRSRPDVCGDAAHQAIRADVTDQHGADPAACPGTGRESGIDLESGDRGLGDHDPAADQIRAIDPAAAFHLKRLFARARQFCREANLAGAMALAGPDKLPADDLADLERSSAEQDRFFDGFLDEILVAPPDNLGGSRVFGVPMSPGQVVGRLGSYGGDIWRRGINWLRRRFRRGPEQMMERRVVDHPENGCEDCPELEARGFVPIGTLPEIGSPEVACGIGCKCHFEYQEMATRVAGG